MEYSELIKKYKTPMYIYDCSILKKRIDYIRSKLNSEYKLLFAVKANPFIVKEMDKYIDGYEICSYGEYEISKKYQLDNKKYVISGVYKDNDSITTMLKDGVRKFTIESINQYLLLKELTEKYKNKIEVLIRLTSNNQFGVSEEDFKKIIEENLDNTYIKIVGVEYFSGTQKHSIKKINKEIDYLCSFIEEIEKDYSIIVEEVEYGTGSPVFYFQDEEFDEDEYFNELNLALEKIKNKKISLEMGRSLVADAGEYITTIVDKKTNQYGNSLILDGGINHLVYYGQTMAMRIPYYKLYPKRFGEENIYNLYGSLCTINDIIVKNIKLTCPEIGDYFIFQKVGAYSITEGIALFLSREMPCVLIKKEDGRYLLVRDHFKTSNINYSNYEVEE